MDRSATDVPPSPPHERIAFNKPIPMGREIDYVLESIERGHLSASGYFSAQVAALLADVHNAADALLTTSCSDALEMAALLLDIDEGDVVIVPSFTFVSTALAFARAGATIRFADIEPETLGLDPASVHQLLDERVRAVVPVHYGGVGCDMAGLARVVGDADIAIVEDNAHGLFGSVAGRPLGSLGRMSTVSFHETKNFSCGEGGALILNDPADVDRAHVLLHKGTNRRAFQQQLVDRYTWLDTGSSFGISDMLAAYLWGQLEQRDAIMTRRERAWRRYHDRLESLETEFGVQRMILPPDRNCAWHLYYVLLADAAHRPAVIDELDRMGIDAPFHYVPLHSSPAGRKASDTFVSCPVTEDISRRLVRLPFHNWLQDSDIDRVADSLRAVLRRIAS